MKKFALTIVATAALLAPVASATAGTHPEHPDKAKGPKAGKVSKAKAYGKYCKGQSKKHVKGQKGTDFSRCVNAMAKADRDDSVAARKACKALSDAGIRTNLTLCFQPLQALMVAKAGAFLVSPFIGRLDDIGEDGMDLIRAIRVIYDNYGLDTKILAASIRHTNHLLHCALAGADVATVPFGVIKKMMSHPLTDSGIKTFLADYAKAFGS